MIDACGCLVLSLKKNKNLCKSIEMEILKTFRYTNASVSCRCGHVGRETGKTRRLNFICLCSQRVNPRFGLTESSNKLYCENWPFYSFQKRKKCLSFQNLKHLKVIKKRLKLFTVCFGPADNSPRLRPCGSFPGCFAALQQLNHQATLQRAQLAAVVLLQDRRQFSTQTLQVGQRGTVRNVQQDVEELLPQVAVRNPAEGDVFISSHPPLKAVLLSVMCFTF